MKTGFSPRRVMNQWLGAAVVLPLMLFGTAFGQSAGDVVKIEEYWEATIRDPDTASTAPQLTSSFAPVRQGNVLYATFNVNHHLYGNQEFGAGGLQLQLWHGDLLLATKTSDKKGLLATLGEVIKWRQIITLQDGVVKFSISNGTSQTFGNFGGSLAISVQTNLPTLNDYRPSDSIDHSGVVYAANRVNSFRLTKVVKTKHSGASETIITSN